MPRSLLRGTLPGQKDRETKPDGRYLTSGGNDQGDYWWDGSIGTDYGFVIVYSVRWGSGDQRTILRLIYGGRLHTRWIDKMYWPRTLVTLAKRFAAEIAHERSGE